MRSSRRSRTTGYPSHVSRVYSGASTVPMYLLFSWHPTHRPNEVAFPDEQRWSGLEVLATTAGAPDDKSGVVEFVARYELGGRRGELHEVSEFVRHDGRWVYLTAA